MGGDPPPRDQNDPQKGPPQGGDPPPQGDPPLGGGTPPQKVKNDPPGPKIDPLTRSATKNAPEKSPMKKAEKLHNQGGALGAPLFDPQNGQKDPPRGGGPPPTPKWTKMTPKWSKMTQKWSKWTPIRGPPPSGGGTPPLDPNGSPRALQRSFIIPKDQSFYPKVNQMTQKWSKIDHEFLWF